MPRFFKPKKEKQNDLVPGKEGVGRDFSSLVSEDRAEEPETLVPDPENPSQAPVKTDEPASVGHLPEKSNHAMDMTRGNSYSLLLRFSLPLLLGNLFQQLYNTVDSMVVGNMVGKTALAAVGAGFPFLMAMVSFSWVWALLRRC